MLKRLKELMSGRPRVDYSNVQRNDDCPCGSSRKFKHCCIDKVEKTNRARRDEQMFKTGKR